MSADHILELVETIESGKYQELCPNRIWHLWQACHSQAEKDCTKLDIVKLLGDYGYEFEAAITHEDHSACSFDFCEFSSRNFTAIKQYHEPSRHEEGDQIQVADQHDSGKTCFRLQELFDDNKLCRAVEDKKLTAWNLDGSAILEYPRPYMAISHVWSDGTGAGTWGPKQVNECLYRYFKRIALRYRCEGIWWDTLCVPFDRQARSKALDTMDANYEYAKLTLVHDRFLRNLDFEGSEKALFAIAMSPWFTRGWTALELAKSGTVKVIFKNAIKDLDKDILEPVPNYPIGRFIGILRNSPRLSIKNLLLVLKARYTSWLKDRAAIAGLLAGVAIPNSDYDTFQRDTYQRILRSTEKVCHSHLFHNSITMEGEFSWCATSLFNLPYAPESPAVNVNPEGSIHGEWRVFPLAKCEAVSSKKTHGVYLDLRRKRDEKLYTEKEEPKEEQEKARRSREECNSSLLCSLRDSHRLVQAKLQKVLQKLEKKNNYLLLFKPNIDDKSNYRRNAALVKVFTMNNGEKFKCQFVGSLEFIDQPIFLDGDDGDLRLDLTIGDTKNGWSELKEDAWETLRSVADKQNQNHDQNGERSEEAARGDVSLSSEEPQEYRQRGEGELTEFTLNLGWSDLHRDAWLRRKRRQETSLESLQLQDCLGQLPIHIAAERGAANQDSLESWLPDETIVDHLDLNEQSPLHHAAWGGSVASVKFLLEKQADQALKDKNGNTALHVASEMGFAEVVKALLPEQDLDTRAEAENGSMPRQYAASRAQTNDGLTPLHYAALRGHYDVAEAILCKPVSIDAETYQIGWTSLHYAADNGDAAVVELLLMHGAKPDAKDHILGWTPLHLAAMSGHRLVVERLVEKLVENKVSIQEKDKNGWIPIHFASVNGHRVVVETLQRHSTGIMPRHDELFWKREAAGNHEAVIDWIKTNHDKFDKKLCNWLYLAALNGDTPVTELTVSAGWMEADKSDQFEGGDRLVHDAAGYGFNGTMSFLAKTDLSISAATTDGTKQTPLHLACRNGRAMTVQWLLSMDASVDEQDCEQRTPLHWAACNGHGTIVQLLWKYKANIHVQARDGRAALHLAAKSGHLDIVKFLIDKKSHVQAQDNDGQTPLHLAAESGHESVVQLLLDNGADKTPKDDRGRTPLWLAAINMHERTMGRLKTCNDADARDSVGRTPLHVAALEGQVSLLQWLIDRGYGVEPARDGKTAADAKHSRIRATDIGGRTALHYAAANGQLDVIRWLVQDNAPVLAEDNDGRIPLHCGAEHGQKAIVDSLLRPMELDEDTQKQQLDAVDSRGQTPLHYAVINGHEDSVDALLGRGADLWAKDQDGCQPLHYAASRRNDASFEKLYSKLEKEDQSPNRNRNPADNKGRTLLHLAAGSENQMAVERLLKACVVVDVRDCDEWTPLLYAATSDESCSKLIMQRLLREKPELLNMADKFKRTALHHAALRGREATVQLLLEHSARRVGQPGSQSASASKSELASEEEALDRKRDASGQTPLHCAAAKGHLDVVKLLSKRASLDQKDRYGWTPLHCAAEGGYVAVIKYLIKQEATVSAKDKLGWTALHLAAMSKHAACVKWLIGNGANIDEKNGSDQTLLHHAADMGRVDVVELLLDNRANIIAQDGSEQRPLHRAATNGHADVVRLLVQKGADVQAKDELGRTAIHHASMTDRVEIVSYLWESNGKIDQPDEKGRTPLSRAAEHGSEAAVRWLLAHDANIGQRDKDGVTPLHYAAKSGNPRLVQMLLVKRAEIRAQTTSGETALHYACGLGRKEVVDVLLSWDKDIIEIKGEYCQKALLLAAKGGYVNVLESLLPEFEDSGLIDIQGMKRQTMLHCAATHGQQKAVQWLVKRRARIDVQDGSGNRPLHCAASQGHKSIVEFLCKENADVEAANKDGHTPLHRAAQGGSVDVVKFILEQLKLLRINSPDQETVNLQVPDRNGCTPLHCAAENGHHLVMPMLMSEANELKTQNTSTNASDEGTRDQREQVNLKDRRGQTPLHYAARHGRYDAAEWLLRHGARVEARDECQVAPLHFAAESGRQEIIKLLLQNKAELTAVDDQSRTALDVAVASGQKTRVSAFIASLDEEAFVEAVKATGIPRARLAAIEAVGRQVATSKEVQRVIQDTLELCQDKKAALKLSDQDIAAVLKTLETLYNVKLVPDEILKIVTKCFDTVHSGIKLAAVRVFQCHQSPAREFSGCCDFLKPRWQINQEAVIALQNQKSLDTEVVDKITDLLGDKRPYYVQEAAAKALQKSGKLPASTLNRLVECLEEGKNRKEVRIAASEALRDQEDISDDMVERLAKRCIDGDEPALRIQSLQNKGKALKPEMLTGILNRSTASNEACKAALVIFQARDDLEEELLNAIVDHLRHPDQNIRDLAVSTFRKQESLVPGTLGAMKECLTSPKEGDDFGIRVSFLEALQGRLNNSDFPDIKKFLEEGDTQVKVAAYKAFRFLSPLSGDVKRFLDRGLQSSNVDVQISAVQAYPEDYSVKSYVIGRKLLVAASQWMSSPRFRGRNTQFNFPAMIEAIISSLQWSIVDPEKMPAILGPDLLPEIQRQLIDSLSSDEGIHSESSRRTTIGFLQRQKIVDPDFIKYMESLLTHEDYIKRREAIEVLQNLPVYKGSKALDKAVEVQSFRDMVDTFIKALGLS